MKTQIGIAALAVVTVSTPLVLQQNSMKGLRAENRALSARAGALDQLRDRNAGLLRAQFEFEEMEKLRRFEQDLARLSQEEEDLRREDLAARLELQERLRAAQAAVIQTRAEVEKAVAETRFEQVQEEVIDTMKTLGLAARIWAVDNDDVFPPFPPSIVSLTNELGVGFVIADLEKTYELFQPPDDSNPNLILFREKEIRPTPDGGWVRNYTMADGSVQTLKFARREEFAAWERNYLLEP